VRKLADAVDAAQLVYGSDRPVVEPESLRAPGELDWDALAGGARRALGEQAFDRRQTVVSR